MSKNEAIVLYQPLLYAIALRMVGTLEDAEDIVQDTFEKWLKLDTSKITNAKAYLVKSVQNNAINFLKNFRSRFNHDSVDDPEVTQNISDEVQTKRLFSFDIDAQVNHAWKVLHHKLEPLEKSIFVMREVFNVEYDQLQEIYDKKVENLRQIVSRAKAKLNEESSNIHIPKASDYIPESFKKACSGGHLTALFHELTEDIKSKMK